MKNCRTAAKNKLNDFNKKIKEALFRGEIISSIARRGNGDLLAKFTQTIINDIRYYGIWEKDLLEGKWHLLEFGEKKEVEPEWKDIMGFWTQHDEHISPIRA